MTVSTMKRAVAYVINKKECNVAILAEDGHLGPKHIVSKVKVKDRRNNLLHC
jgi:hypothetical protein